MPIRVGIDGFGGISRQFFMAVQAGGFSDLFEVSVVNEPAGPESVAQRLRFDSIYGRCHEAVTVDGGQLQIAGRQFHVTEVAKGSDLDWEKAGADIVVVDAGIPDLASRIQAHREKGARKVIIAGRGAGDDAMIMFGQNDGSYDPDAHHIVATGSAAANAVSPVASILHQGFGIARGGYTIVRPIESGQPVADTVGGDGRSGRAGTGNIVPRLAADITAELTRVQPAMDGKLDGIEVSVPVAPVGWVNLSVETERRFSREDAIEVFTEAASSDAFTGLIGLAEGPVVSADFVGDARSVVVDVGDLAMLGHALISVRGWFDVEWGLACRTADLVALVCEAGVPGTA